MSIPLRSNLRVLGAALLLCLPSIVSDATITWDDGAGDSNWQSALNWDTDTVPGAGDDAVINLGGGLDVSVSTTESVNSITCNDALTLSAGTLTIAAASTINDFTQTGGTLTGAGTVTLTGTASWVSGTQSGSGNTTVQAGVTLTVTAASATFLDTRTLTNAGTIDFLGTGNLYFYNGATLANNAGGTLDLQNNVLLTPSTGGGNLTNAGTLKKSAGVGTATISVVANNSGTLDAQTGTLNLTGNGSHTAGTWTVAAGATLGFTGSTHNFSGAHAGIISGTLNAATTLTFATTAAFDFTGNGLSWTTGIWNGGGTLTNDGTLTITANSATQLQATTTLSNDDTINLIGTANFYFLNASVLANNAGGTLDLQSDALITASTGGGSLTNAGTFQKSAGTGTSTVSIALNNTGTVDVQSGTLSSTGSFTNFSGTTLTGGTYDVQGVFRFAGADIVTNSATIVLDGASSAIQNSGGGDAFANFATNGGAGSLGIKNSRNLTTSGALSNAGSVTVNTGCTLTTTGNYTQTGGTTTLSSGTIAATTVDVQAGTLSGTGTISADLANAGQLTVGGSTGILSVTGNYTQTSGGSLNMELQGTTPGTGHDQLAVTGTATLDGTLGVSLPAFTPTPGNAFLVLTYASNSGTFATTTGVDLGGGLALDPTYNASDLTLTHNPSITETTTSFGLSGASTATPGAEVLLFGLGLTGDGVSTVTSVDVTVSDLTAATGLAQGDFSELRLYSSADAALGGDTQLGSMASGSINLGSATSVSAASDVIPWGTERFYLVSAVLAAAVTDGHTLRLGFGAGDVSTSVGGRGSVVTASDADRVAIDVVATQLVFATQPAGSVSGLSVTVQPVVEARDAAGLVDADFAETVTLTESSAGSLANATAVAVAGVANFASVTYSATADGQAFTLTANDQDGVDTDLPSVDANALSSDVVATQLVFATQPAPLTGTSGAALDFTTDPVVEARDAAGTVDADFSDTVTLTETGVGSAAYANSAVTAIAGVAAFTGLTITYTATGDGEPFGLRADDTTSGSEGDLPTSDSSDLSSDVVATVLTFLQGPNPTSVQTGEDFAVSDVTIAAKDADGLTDTDYATAISLDAGGSSGTLSASPGADVVPVSGVSSWTQLSFSSAGQVQLRATSGSLTDATSGTVTVSAPAPPPAPASPTADDGDDDGNGQPPPVVEEPAPSVVLTGPARLDFGRVPVGSSRTLAVTIGNTGTGFAGGIDLRLTPSQTGLFVLGRSTLALESGASLATDVTFTATVHGDVSALLTVSGSGSSLTVQLVGRAASTQPLAVVRPTDLDFGTAPVETAGSLTLTVTNEGLADLQVTGISLGTDRFEVTPDTFGVADGDSQLVTVTYRRALPGRSEDSLRFVVSGAPPDAIPLTGTADAAILSPTGDALSFDDDPASLPAVGETRSRSLVLLNAGTLPLHIDSLEVESPFETTPARGSIDPGDSLTVEVVYAPTVPGIHAQSLSIRSNDWTGEVFAVQLSGATLGMVGPRIVVVDSLDLGYATPGDTVRAALLLENAGNRDLHLSAATVDGPEFSLRFEREPIIPGDSGRLEVLFHPTAGGGVDARLTLTADDPLLPIVPVWLVGRGRGSGSDFDGDDEVGFRDFFLFADAFGGDDLDFDLNGDGEVDFEDFFVFADAFAPSGSSRRAQLLSAAHERLGLPQRPALGRSYPNPFNHATLIPFDLTEFGHVSLAIYDITGQRIRILVRGPGEPGPHQVAWDGRDDADRPVGSGSYLAVLRTPAAVHATKLLLVR